MRCRRWILARFSPTIIAALMVLLFDHCSAPAPKPTSIRIGIGSEIATTNPHAHDDSTTWTVQANVYEGLVAFDRNMKVVPALATTWENPNDRTWRFFLRKGVRFHDGSMLTVADVIYSIHHALGAPDSVVRGRLAGVQGVDGPVAGAVVITTAAPDPVLLNKLVSVYIVPKDSLSAGSERAIGTGPYRLKALKRTGTVYLERFADYWGGEATIEQAVFIPLTDPARRLRQLLEDKVQLVGGLAVEALPTVQRNSRTKAIASPETTLSYLGFRFGGDRNLFDDRRFRLAIHLGIDAARAIKEGFIGFAEPANQPVLKSIFGYNPMLPVRRYDPDLARRLLAEMGVEPGTRLTLEMTRNSANRVAKSIHRDLQNIGLDVTIVSYSWKELYERLMRKQSAFYMAGWTCGSGDASDFLDSCIHTPVGSFGQGNVGGYSDPALDGLIEESRMILQGPRRLAALNRIMRIVMADLPIVPLYFVGDFYGASRRVAWNPRPDGRILVRDIRVQEE